LLIFLGATGMKGDSSDIFEADRRNELLAIALQITNGSKKLADYCDELRLVLNLPTCYQAPSSRDTALSRDAETRRKALNELAFVVTNLPKDFLADAEGN
jgi:hypothetical protein